MGKTFLICILVLLYPKTLYTSPSLSWEPWCGIVSLLTLTYYNTIIWNPISETQNTVIDGIKSFQTNPGELKKSCISLYSEHNGTAFSIARGGQSKVFLRSKLKTKLLEINY